MENIYDVETSISSIYPTGLPSITITDLRGTISGEFVYDDVKLEQFYSPKFKFLMVNEDDFLDIADGMFGLNFENNSNQVVDNQNIISKLYYNNQIKKQIFTFNIKDEMRASFSIGEMPKYIKNNKLNYSTCKMRNGIGSIWNCYVTHILFDENYDFYNAIQLDNIIANFATGFSNIYLPLKFLDLFMNNYFKTFPNYNKDSCIIKKFSKSKNILCQNTFLNTNGSSIHFIINGYAYKIPFDELFDDIFSDSYGTYKIFKITFMDTPNNEWFLGTVFMKQYEMVFDAEKKVVGFYGGFKYDFTKLSNENIEEYCPYNTIVVIFLALLMIIPSIQTVIHNRVNMVKDTQFYLLSKGKISE